MYFIFLETFAHQSFLHKLSLITPVTHQIIRLLYKFVCDFFFNTFHSIFAISQKGVDLGHFVTKMLYLIEHKDLNLVWR